MRLGKTRVWYTHRFTRGVLLLDQFSNLDHIHARNVYAGFTATTGIPNSTFYRAFVQLGIVWLVVLLSNFHISESKWLVNIGALLKAGLILVLGGSCLRRPDTRSR